MKQAKVLTPTELKRVLRVAQTMKHGARNRLVVLLSYLAGLRACEIASLRVSDVARCVVTSFDIAGEIRLDCAQTKGKKTQTVVLNCQLRREIKQFLESQACLPDPNSPLFVSQKGQAFSSQTIQNLFRSLYHAAGIRNASSHSGRRTFITNLSEKGVSARVIQQLARHSSLVTTQRYIDVSVDKLRNAADLVCA